MSTLLFAMAPCLCQRIGPLGLGYLAYILFGVCSVKGTKDGDVSCSRCATVCFVLDTEGDDDDEGLCVWESANYPYIHGTIGQPPLADASFADCVASASHIYGEKCYNLFLYPSVGHKTPKYIYIV
jgi:hypothetical protein